jgi:hypothetical protein
MPAGKEEIILEAIESYSKWEYGTLPDPVDAEALANDPAFNAFSKKFETAFRYYETTGFSRSLMRDQMSGIDFNGPVDLVTIPKGQAHTQTQVAWGAKGTYYSTSHNTPEMMGISSKGKQFDPQSIPGHLKADHESRINEMRAKMMHAVGKNAHDFDSQFPVLPPASGPAKSASVIITNKKVRTYEAGEDVIALKSTAKKVEDTWSVPDEKISCAGGGMQLFVSPAENSKMQLVNYGAHDKPQENKYQHVSPH